MCSSLSERLGQFWVIALHIFGWWGFPRKSNKNGRTVFFFGSVDHGFRQPSEKIMGRRWIVDRCGAESHGVKPASTSSPWVCRSPYLHIYPWKRLACSCWKKVALVSKASVFLALCMAQCTSRIPGNICLVHGPLLFHLPQHMTYTGWCFFCHPSEKYEFVSWDEDIPNIWKNKIHVPNHQPV